MNATLLQPVGRDARATKETASFPSVSLPGGPGRVPIEVSLVARLGHGAGDKLFYEAQARQRQHDEFVDALDEPSARLGATDFPGGDETAVYTFGVGTSGHPFHRHAGHRVFTAVSGSGGAQLRFSPATPADLARDPASFLRALHYVNVPPDCLFIVRFSGATWHQFVPLHPRSGHPALFAVSTHTNELGGDLSDALRAQVLRDAADIPSLTELLPRAVADLFTLAPPRASGVPTTELSLHDRPGGLLERACRHFRSFAGHVRRWRAGFGFRPGFVRFEPGLQAVAHERLSEDCLLREHLHGLVVNHEDAFTLTVRPALPNARDGVDWLVAALDGFMVNPPPGVTRMMALRNVLVRPFGLRTSALACPVSSLLSTSGSVRFENRFPVHAQRVADDRRSAQVILGADDKHLVFRSCVGVRLLEDGTVEFSLSDRVACVNLFGRVYMALIARTHRRLIAPAVLARAVESAIRNSGSGP